MPGFKFISSGSSSSVPGIGVGSKNINVDSITATTANVTNLYGQNKIFHDKHTMPLPLGQYQVDAIPLTINQTFSSSKFSRNVSTGPFSNNPDPGLTKSPSGPYSNELFVTTGAFDMLIYAPSNRTSLETSFMFSQTDNEIDNLASVGYPIEDMYGRMWTLGFNSNNTSIYGPTLASKLENLRIICSSGTTTTGARTAALLAVQSDPDYAYLRANMKMPYKTYNNIKGASDFEKDTLNDLSGVPLDDPTTITRTSYSTTGCLLPVSNNVNATGGKMGLLLDFSHALEPLCYFNLAYGAASFGYVVVRVSPNHFTPNFIRYKGKTSFSKLFSDGVINNNTNNEFTANPFTIYGAQDGTNYNRLNSLFNSSSIEARRIYERYFYTIKCALKYTGLHDLIDFNNVVASAFYFGGYSLVSLHNLLENPTPGNSVVYRPGTPLYRMKAMIGTLALYDDNSIKVDSGLIINNNRFALGINVLKCPLFHIVGDGSIFSSINPSQDLSVAQNAQTIFQCTKQSSDLNANRILSQSAVFYKPVLSYVGDSDTDTGLSGGLYTFYLHGNQGLWLNGWSLPLTSRWPDITNLFESGLQNETVYGLLEDIKTDYLTTLLAHRYLGRNFPVSIETFGSLGYKCDFHPTSCQVSTSTEYLDVCPYSLGETVSLGRISYDENYNMTISATTRFTNSTGASILATGANQSIATTRLFATSATGPAIVASSGGVQIGNWVLSVDGSGNLVINPV